MAGSATTILLEYHSTGELPGNEFSLLVLRVASVPRQDWIRIYPKETDPVFFNKNRGNRFTPPDGRYEVMYVGDSVRTSFLECFGDELYAGHKRLSRSRCQSKAVARLSVPPLSLCDLSDQEWLAAIGLDKGALYSTSLIVPQTWSKAMMEHPARFEGIVCESRFGSGKCIALFRCGAMSGLHEIERYDLHGSSAGDALIDEFQIALV